MPSKRKPYTIRKFNGDDSLSWAVFRAGSSTPIDSGLSHYEAMAVRDRFIRELEAGADRRTTL